MQNLIGRLEEAVGGSVKGNVAQMLANAYKAFWGEVRGEVQAAFKKSTVMNEFGDLAVEVESSGFDWPVLVVMRNDEIAYDLEMELSTEDLEGKFVVNSWDGAMQKDTKVLKAPMSQMTADAAAKFLINYVRKDVATALSKR